MNGHNLLNKLTEAQLLIIATECFLNEFLFHLFHFISVFTSLHQCPPSRLSANQVPPNWRINP